MSVIRPRIYGWRLAAGVVVWLVAALAMAAQVLASIGNPPVQWIEALALPVALLVVAALFWRGNRVARWLGLVPAVLLLVAAAFTWGVVGMCTPGIAVEGSEDDPGTSICFSEPSVERLQRNWPITAGLAASGVVVLIGIWRPGVRVPEEMGTQ